KVYGSLVLVQDHAVRCHTITREIAGLKSSRIHRHAHVDSEVSWLSKYHTVTGRVSGTHRQWRKDAYIINILLVLAPVGIEVERRRIRYVTTRIIGYDRDVIADLVLVRITFERIKCIAHCNIWGPGNASVGAPGIE